MSALAHRRNALGRALVALTFAGTATACSATPEQAARTGCTETVGEAASAIEIDDQVRFLDEALLQCRSVAALTNELARHPGLIGYSPQGFVSSRCSRIDDPATLRAPVCASVITPTSSTLPVTTIAELLYVGETLDGRPVEIRPSASTEFVGDIPAVIQQTVDIAQESGCDGLLEQRDLWFGRVDATPAGDEASVYAQHAQLVAVRLGCELPDLPEQPG